MTRTSLRAALVTLSSVGLLSACLGTTGYKLVSFYASASGPADAVKGQPYPFTNDHGFDVVLTQATIHIGAIYLDQSLPTSGGGAEPCTLPGTYVGEVRGGTDFDMLDPSLQGFGVAGNGTTLKAALGQVWLTGGDVNAEQDPTTILALKGTATGPDGKVYPFQASITIDASLQAGAASTTLPGESPICLKRIVTPILTNITLGQSGILALRLDPKNLFTNVDVSTFKQFSKDPSAPLYGCTDAEVGTMPTQGCLNLFNNLVAAGPVYRFEWLPAQ